MSALLECKDVRTRRGSRRVIDGVSFQIARGELVALVGPNGSGKSTLLESIAGTCSIESGSVELAGTAIHDLDLHERSRRFALVGRESRAAHPLSVEATVRLGRLPHQTGSSSNRDQAVVDQVLSETDCSHLRERPLWSLSDGERARVHFARALAQQAPLLLLDEATAHLDLAHRERSFQRVKDFTGRGGAVLCVAHELELALRHATRVIVLSKGRIAVDDHAERALTSSVLESIFQIHAEVELTSRGATLRVHGATS